jgi:hypothetical protein
MANGVTSGTGALPEVQGTKFSLKLDFGTGSVDVEEKMPSGNFIKIETGITADYSKVYDGFGPTTLRFNVTSHSAPIEWKIDAV